ncbi:Plastid division protein PDV2 [Abeliophyllum distichum]|uniref:Plastid division protein PDV2 n=1 Tax=Abeliophyllum distichum TaxID=126358 RepID=A0ABD1THJ5_9LAMI
MDEDRISLVLARASELRSKITSCIRQATSNVENQGKETDNKESEASPVAENEVLDDDEEEIESLLNIRDALESLEAQLSSLQALQQQQWYEKETALAQIEYSQEKLLKKLKEYKGKDLDFIHEAIAFAGETEDNSDLLLPPYPSRPSRSLVSDNGHISIFPSMRKYTQNGAITGGLKNLESERNQTHPGLQVPFNWMKSFLGAAARTALTITGVILVLSLAGFEPRLKKRDNQFKILGAVRPARDY